MKLKIATIAFFWSSLFAAPQGFVCKAGDATYAENVVQSSGRAVVYWDSFSLASGETIHFEQSGLSPAILNRVVGKLPSEIHGSIHSNGTVWLINRNGIVIGEQGRINAANFLASTLDLLDSDFLGKNEFTFTGTRGCIEQSGVIECPDGYVMLMSPEHIDQSGTIRAAKVGLGVGEEILFVPKNSPLMAIRLSSMEETENRYSKAIQHKGLIEAKGFEERGGEVYLIAERLTEVTGEIVAEGGVVHVLGEEVVHMGNARVDVSGEKGGGTLLVGGDYQGKNPAIRNAKYNWMGPEVRIYADAIESGNGGKVIFWADEVTCAYGNVSARGGELSGDGGFVEISAENLDFRGFTDRRAPNGKAGTLLLDPWDVTISSGVDANVTFSTPNYTIDNSGANIQASNIATNLGTGNVNISTSRTTGSPNQQGIINIQASAGSTITWSADHTLILQADTSVVVASGVTIARTGTGTSDAMNFVANGWQSGHSTGSTNGLDITGALTADTGEILLIGIGGLTGGSGVILNNGGSVAAPTITIMGIGGNGTASQRGFNMVAGSTLGSSTTTDTITVTGYGGGMQAGGAASSNHGILIQGGTIQTKSTGTVTLNGTGGGSGTGSTSHGVYFLTAGATYTTIDTLTISGQGGSGSGGGHRGVLIGAAMSLGSADLIVQDCVGGTGGSSNYGTSVEATVTTTGGILFDNIAGGGSGTGTSHYGLYVTTNGVLRAPTITAQDITGGDGTSANSGFIMDSTAALGSDGTAGTPATTKISITATGGMGAAATSDNPGIRINAGTITADSTNGGTFTFSGTGGGNSTMGTSSNMGIRLTSVTFANANIINFTGVGGAGTSVSNTGVAVASGGTIAFSGITPTNVNFLNCSGGTGTNDIYGVTIESSFSISTGTILLSNIKGGTGTTIQNYGVRVASTLAAPTIIGTGILGGSGSTSGTTNHYGFYLNGGTLGSASTNSISITATGGGANGSTAGNDGIRFVSGTITTAASGTATFIGRGGGATGGSGNSGVRFQSGTLTCSSNLAQLTIQGTGGVGSGSYGVRVLTSITCPGSTAITFKNCVGGSGGSGLGVSIDTAGTTVSTAGDILFQNIRGGPDSTANYGVLVNASTNAILGATITARDIFGGGSAGTTNNHGFYNLGTLGNSTTTSIDITAVGGGTTSSNVGILLQGGAITMSSMATTSVTLNGTGGGGDAGSGNYGIQIVDNAGTHNTFTNIDTLQLTAIGGDGANSYGVYWLDDPVTITGSTDLTFKNCVGGTGDSGVAVTLRGDITTTGAVVFDNISGGGAVLTGNNWGLDLRMALDAATITGTGIKGGANGVDSNYGFLLNSGGILGSASTTSINISATGGGTGAGNRGIYLIGGSGSSVLASGPVTLNGVASSLTTGDTNVGIEVRGVIFGAGITSLTLIGTGGGTSTGMGSSNTGVLFAAANPTFTAPSSLATFTIQGMGGAGSSEGVGMGRALDLGSTATDFIFQNCVGGPNAPGVRVSNSIIATGSGSSCTFTNCTGGNSSTANYGVSIIAGASINVETISASNINGGAGTDTNIGFYMTGGNLGGANTSSITVTAGSFGTGVNNHGIWLSSGTMQASGTVTLIGSGSTAATGDGSSGIVMDGVTLSSATTLNLTGTGGSGGAGTRGIDIGAVAAPTFPGSLTTMRLTGHGGSGSSLTDGVRISTSLNALSASAAALTFLNCSGGTTGRGVLVTSAITATDITFTNCTGGAGSSNNNGVEVGGGGALDATTITGTSIAGGTGTSGSGFAITGGSVGTTTTTNIDLTATANGTSSTHCGILLAAGTIVADTMTASTITLHGTGSFLASGTSNCGILSSGFTSVTGLTLSLTGFGGTGTSSNRGIGWQSGSLGNTAATSLTLTGVAGGTMSSNTGVQLLAGTIDLASSALTITGTGGGISTGSSGNYGIALTNTTYSGISSFTFTGIGGRGTNEQHGVVVNKTTALTLPNSATFLNCQGGSGGINNAAVAFEQDLTLSSGTLTFTNCSGGTGSSDNYGIWVEPGITLTAPTITATGITSGTGTSGNHGFYCNQATLTCAGNLNIAATTITGSTSAGIYFDTGVVATIGGTTTLMGSGSSTTSTTSHGIWLAGASTNLTTADDAILTGTAGLGGGHAILIETQAAITATTTATLSLNGNDIALGLSTLTTATGDITCNSPVTLIANPTLTSTSGDITFNDTVDGAFNLTVSGTTGTLHFVRAVGGTTPLTNLTLTPTNLRIDDNITLTGANALTIPSATTIGGTSTIENNTAAITWNGTIDEVMGTTARLTLSTSGAITLGADIGNTSSLTTFAATGPVTLGASIDVIATEDITFSNTINATTASIESLTLNAGSTGNITLSSAVGATNRLGFLTIDNAYDVTTNAITAVFIDQILGSGTSTFGALDTNAAGGLLGVTLIGNRFQFDGLINTANNGPVTVTNSGIATINANIFTEAGSITFSGPVAVTGSRTLDTNDSLNDLDDIEFLDAINGPGDLTLVADDLIFHSSAGGSTPFGTIDATATTTSIGGNQYATGTIAYHSPVTTTATAVISGSALTFDSTITTDGNSLTLLSTNDTTVSGTTTTSGGNLDITSTDGSIFVASINTSAVGTIGGHILLQPSRGLTPGVLGNIPVGTITLNGDLDATGSTNGWISLAPEARGNYPSIATIFSPPGVGVTLTGGTLTIGKNETMTILGDLTIGVDTIASLGDLVALGSLTVNGVSPMTPAPVLISYERGPIPILNSSGILVLSQSQHFVYQSGLSFDVDLASANLRANGTLTLADLQYIPNSYTLNFDPGIPIPIIPEDVLENAIDRLLIALSEMSDRLPLFTPKPFSASICLKDEKGETCFYEEPRFVSFLPENKVD